MKHIKEACIEQIIEYSGALKAPVRHLGNQ